MPSEKLKKALENGAAVSQQIMRAVLGLKPGERAANEERSQVWREPYQVVQAEVLRAREFWSACSKEERRKFSPSVEALDWGFLQGPERDRVTRDLLYIGKIEPDLAYEATLEK